MRHLLLLPVLLLTLACSSKLDRRKAEDLINIGAYVAGLLVLRAGVPAELALLLAPLAAAIGACLFGWFSVRLSGVYMAMLTLAFAQIGWSIVFQWDRVTGGSNGLDVTAVKFVLQFIKKLHGIVQAEAFVLLGASQLLGIVEPGIPSRDDAFAVKAFTGKTFGGK